MLVRVRSNSYNFNFILINNKKEITTISLKGKVATGKARYLLNIVFNTWWFKSTLFRKLLKNKYYLKEYSLIGKIGSFKLQISSSSLDALVRFFNLFIFFLFIFKFILIY